MSYSKQEDGEVAMKLLPESSPRLSTSSTVADDLEANNKEAIDHTAVVLEYQTPAGVKYAWLCALLVFGMLLTVHNKFILEKVNNILVFEVHESETCAKLTTRCSSHARGS